MVLLVFLFFLCKLKPVVFCAKPYVNLGRIYYAVVVVNAAKKRNAGLRRQRDTPEAPPAAPPAAPPGAPPAGPLRPGGRGLSRLASLAHVASPLAH